MSAVRDKCFLHPYTICKHQITIHGERLERNILFPTGNDPELSFFSIYSRHIHDKRGREIEHSKKNVRSLPTSAKGYVVSIQEKVHWYPPPPREELVAGADTHVASHFFPSAVK